jgi:uncharacterized protein involved in cysteine biosynthesis
MGYILRGYAMVYGDPRMRRYVAVPLLVAGALFLVAMIGGYLLIVPMLAGWIKSWGMPDLLGDIAGFLVYATVWVVFAGAIFVSLVGAISPFLWDRLSLEVEEKVNGVAVRRDPSFPAVVMDSVMRIVLALVLSVIALLLGCVTGGLAGVAAAAFIGLFDFTANAYIRRGILFGEQRKRVLRARGWQGFAIGCGIISSVPILNVFSLPAMVAGGTLFCLDAEKGRF